MERFAVLQVLDEGGTVTVCVAEQVARMVGHS
mgnify:CR=1 FL=1